METNYNINTDEKSKNKEVWFIAVVLLAIAVVVFIYLRQPQKIQQTENQKPEIPKELILGQKIETSVALSFPDPNKVNFVQYRTARTLEDLVAFYSKAFSENGWLISEKGDVKPGIYNITAKNKQSEIVANITMLSSFNTQKREQSLEGGINSMLVTITYRKK